MELECCFQDLTSLKSLKSNDQDMRNTAEK